MKKVDRRSFIKNGAVLAGAAVGFPYVVSSSALGKAQATAASDRIVMGCIGVGGQGTYNMRAFLNNPDVQVAAVCDVSDESGDYWGDLRAGLMPAQRIVEDFYGRQKSSGIYKGCGAYKDFRRLLERDDIDAVTVCTPDHWHGLISTAAARAGKDIYCEKPLTNTVAEGRAVCDAVRRYGRVLQTGSHERSNDSARFACELVRNGRIGKLHTIRITLPVDEPHHHWVKENNKPRAAMPVPEGFDYDMWLGSTPYLPYTDKCCIFWWRFILAYGGGEMTDRGAHVIDLAQLGNGTDDTGPVEISARGGQLREGRYDVFMDFEFECTYANGVRMIGQSWGKRGVKFEGTDGWVFINIHGGAIEADPVSLLREIIGPDEIHLGRSAGHHQDFINAVKSRGETIATAEIGHRTATICHLLNIAMQTGRKLVWDPKAERVVNDAEADRMLSSPMRSPWRI
ncbi:MAG: Gfo/Idh/MocA family oxidoreductase [Planctomycetota bacterium]|nr:Gfo/Idh/MocA family oxidoreductase [Planctomycetota bacterium]